MMVMMATWRIIPRIAPGYELSGYRPLADGITPIEELFDQGANKPNEALSFGTVPVRRQHHYTLGGYN